MNATLARLRQLLFTPVFLWILLGAAILIGLTCHRQASSAIPPKVQAELNALKAERPTFLRTIDSLKTSSAAATTRANTSVTQAHTTVINSGVNRRLADSLAVVAAADSSAEASSLQWRHAYTARTLEADSLRVAVALLDSAQAERERARVAISAALAISEARRERSEKVNSDLQKAIARASAPCKVLWVVPCVSRTTAFAVGAVAGAAIAYTVKP